jgi:hypothetical protein
MNCLEILERLDDAADGELSPLEQEEVRLHIGSCDSCRSEKEALDSLLEGASALPRSIEPGRDLWEEIEPRLRRRSRPGAGKRVFAIAATVIATVGAAWYLARRAEPAWSSSIFAPNAAPGRSSQLANGSTLQTDESTRAKIENQSVGSLVVEPNTRLRLITARPGEHRFALERGTIHATTWVPPRVFVVETPSGEAVDLGCEYRLVVDDSGKSFLLVTAGWVELAWKDREVVVPAAAVCRARPGCGPGTPCSEHASDTLRRALERFDVDTGNSAALEIVLANARREDAVTLWNLISVVTGPGRERVVDGLAALVPIPRGATREGILNLDGAMLELWWNSFEPVPISGLKAKPSAWTRVLDGLKRLTYL